MKTSSKPPWVAVMRAVELGDLQVELAAPHRGRLEVEDVDVDQPLDEGLGRQEDRDDE
ncbi:hypothetical protein [Nannocystis pusilla]|uniref:hypothetical protein n=1 Tax=Nannocystis pusilla TaxID=889268 RepID=UPI003DA22978